MVTRKNFYGLQREWYRKLRDSGFRDIEKPDGQLRGPERQYGDPSRSWDAASPVERAAVEAYFRGATMFQYTKPFRALTEQRRQIWRLHAKGASNAEIVQATGATPKAVRVAIRRGRMLACLPEVTSTIGHGRQSGNGDQS